MLEPNFNLLPPKDAVITLLARNSSSWPLKPCLRIELGLQADKRSADCVAVGAPAAQAELQPQREQKPQQQQPSQQPRPVQPQQAQQGPRPQPGPQQPQPPPGPPQAAQPQAAPLQQPQLRPAVQQRPSAPLQQQDSIGAGTTISATVPDLGTGGLSCTSLVLTSTPLGALFASETRCKPIAATSDLVSL